MGAIDGKIIGLKVNGSFVSCETSCSLHFESDLLPASAVTSGGWKEFLYGIRSWTMSANGNLLLESVPSDIKALITTGFINQYPLYVQFSTRVSSTIQMVLSGAALLSGGDITAPSNSKATWQANFQGTGPLDTVYNEFDLLIDAMPSEALWPIVVDESTT